MNDDYYDEDWEETYLKTHEETTRAFAEKLPQVVRLYQKSACEVAHLNEVPAAVSFFSLLGQISKDFVAIPNGRNIEDTRIHFCQIQTSGSGKSTLYNFTGPIAKKVFSKINDLKKHTYNERKPMLQEQREDEEGNEWIHSEGVRKTFDTFSVQIASSAALIGEWKSIQEMEEDDNGNERPTGIWKDEFFEGALEGSGFLHYDEFEYSGVFSPSQHQTDTIVILNTLCNTLHGESWINRKRLLGGKDIVCHSERSIVAMTYPPKELNDIMTEKGLLQRMVCFIWDVPPAVLDKIRREVISTAGTIQDVNAPIDNFVKSFIKIYECLEERYQEVLSEGGTSINTMVYTDEFRETLMLEYESMMSFVNGSGLFVREVADSFVGRILKNIIRMAVLCSIAEAPSITDKSKRFIVRGKHVRQAGSINRQCYKTLIDWLERSLRNQRKSVSEKVDFKAIVAIYRKMEVDYKRKNPQEKDAIINKTVFRQKIQEDLKKSQASVYRIWARIESKFIETKTGRTTNVKLIEDQKEVKK